jgi:hypothetical protein
MHPSGFAGVVCRFSDDWCRNWQRFQVGSGQEARPAMIPTAFVPEEIAVLKKIQG